LPALSLPSPVDVLFQSLEKATGNFLLLVVELTNAEEEEGRGGPDTGAKSSSNNNNNSSNSGPIDDGGAIKTEIPEEDSADFGKKSDFGVALAMSRDGEESTGGTLRVYRQRCRRGHDGAKYASKVSLLVLL